MIITKKKSRRNHSMLLCCLFLFFGCYESETGCLDIQAFNYNASSDNDCQKDDDTPRTCPCTYNQLVLNLDFIVDTFDYTANAKYANNLLDTFSLVEAQMLMSNFLVKNDFGDIYRVNESHDINRNGTQDVLDIIKLDFQDVNQNIGTIKLQDSITHIDYMLGLQDGLNNSSYDYSTIDGIQSCIDSNYIDNNNRLPIMRIKYYMINDLDSNLYEHLFFELPSETSMTFVADTLIGYGHNLSIKLSADLAVLFDNVSFDNINNAEEIKSNMSSFIK